MDSFCQVAKYTPVANQPLRIYQCLINNCEVLLVTPTLDVYYGGHLVTAWK